MIDMKAEVNGLNEKVVKMLAERKMTVSAAESCTGGLFAALITNVSGASEVLNESFVTYANSAKMKYLGVKGETLEKHGAVSYETAFEMADGLRKNTGADVTVGIKKERVYTDDRRNERKAGRTCICRHMRYG